MANSINKSSNYFVDSTFKENYEYLNWPGLQYLFYTKIKPLVRNTIGESKNIRDDENWYASYDAETGQVYLVSSDDNQVLFVDSDRSCGSITETGMLQVVVDRSRSAMVDGFIDYRYGCVGPDGYSSDEIGNATGRLYVNFCRGGRAIGLIDDGANNHILTTKVAKLENKVDSTVKMLAITTGGGYDASTISNPEYQQVITDAEDRILASVDNDNKVFVADLITTDD